MVVISCWRFLEVRGKVRGEKPNLRVFLFLLPLRCHTGIIWEDLFQSKDANTCCEIFNTHLTKCFNDSFPLRPLPKKRLKDKPWVGKGLRKCFHKKNRLYKLSLARKDQASIDNYKKYKNILTMCLRQAEENYYNDILKDKANAIYRMWAMMGPMLNPKKSKQSFRTVAAGTRNEVVLVKQKFVSEANKFLPHTSWGYGGAASLPLGSRGEAPGKLCIFEQISS